MEQNTVPTWVKKVADFLKVHKHVKTIYLNDKGEYHLHAIPGFTAVDAAEFINDAEVYSPKEVETIVLPDEPTEQDEPGEVVTEENTVNNPDETIQF